MFVVYKPHNSMRLYITTSDHEEEFLEKFFTSSASIFIEDYDRFEVTGSCVSIMNTLSLGGDKST